MAQHLKIGKVGEQEAVKFLKKKNYKIIDQNFSCKIGEIDIIAYQKDTIVFVEVKTRKNNLFGTPGQAVNKSKQKKIIKTALYYLQLKNKYHENIRFDIVEVWFDKGIKDINIIPNAFSV
ncbi:MAG TPA: YraN family protein [Eubacteriaceae bacterium]|nr:YraN family protein [Eubacteriaceae bacterium]